MRMKLYARHFTKPFHAIWLLSAVGFLILTRTVKVVILILFLFNHTVDTLKNISLIPASFLIKDGQLVLLQNILMFASIASIVLHDYLQKLQELGTKFVQNRMHLKRSHNALSTIVHIW